MVRDLLERSIAWLNCGEIPPYRNYLTEKPLKRIRITMFASVTILFLLQLIILLWFNGSQIDDAKIYLGLATNCNNNGLFYPNNSHLNSNFIFAPGYVNLVILIMKFTTNIKCILFIINIPSCLIIIFSIYKICEKLFKSTIIPYIVVISMCLLPTLWVEVCSLRTELLYTMLAFSSIALIMHNSKKSLLFAGILLTFSNWVRPLAIVFLIVILFIFIVTKVNMKSVAIFTASMICTALLIGSATYISFGHFVFQSTTSGYNLIMGANDDADGSYNATVFTEGKIGYLTPEENASMTFFEKDKFYKSNAIEWIKANPARYSYLFMQKTFYLYANETYSMQALFNGEKNPSGVSYFINLYNDVKNDGISKMSVADVVTISSQIYYMLIILLFLLGNFYAVRLKIFPKILPLLLILFLGTAITIITVGAGRYHFPYLPIIFIIAAITIDVIYQRKSLKLKEKEL